MHHPRNPLRNNPEPIFFWREYEDEYGFLSQWYAKPFDADGEAWQSMEHYMMVHKARLFDDADSEAAMMKAKNNPAKLKAFGRKVAGFKREIWDEHKERVVEEGNMAKFGQGEMREKLLATGKSELVEASPFDRIWGVGYAADDARENRRRWGLNLLGKALMRVRDRLQAEEASA